MKLAKKFAALTVPMLVAMLIAETIGYLTQDILSGIWKFILFPVYVVLGWFSAKVGFRWAESVE